MSRFLSLGNFGNYETYPVVQNNPTTLNLSKSIPSVLIRLVDGQKYRWRSWCQPRKHVCVSGTGAFYFREAISYLITRYQKLYHYCPFMLFDTLAAILIQVWSMRWWIVALCQCTHKFWFGPFIHLKVTLKFVSHELIHPPSQNVPKLRTELTRKPLFNPPSTTSSSIFLCFQITVRSCLTKPCVTN